MITLFIILVFLLFYTFGGYFLLLKVVSFFKSNPVIKGEYIPTASLLIPVYNGEKVIKDKLENCLSLSYPQDKLKIMVISDCSTDKTVEIVQTYKDKGIILLCQGKREGKTKALNLALKEVQSEVVFFTDTSTFLSKDSLIKIAKNFADTKVGCVSGEDYSISAFQEKGESGEGVYVGMEMKLRRLESAICNLTGVSGCLYAIRRELINEIPNDLIDDFYLPLQVVKQGKRVISELEGIAYVTRVANFKEEFKRRRRTALGGLEVFFAELSLLNPFKYGFFSLELLSHKLFRWLTPFLLLLLILCNLFLLQYFIFKLTLLIEIFSIFIALVYLFFLANKKLTGLFSLMESIFYFYLVNLALLFAWAKFILGKREIIWEPSKR
ncbi:MAG: glycosyltransferase family 2 protein [candidate division Zixibacteria bacterium]|nr:glycosyltransferase family 2 protein [candidate division Zixibacteria bacterium]